MSKILIAPLDWGLGHATRMIPIIQYLKECGCEIIIAADGSQQKLLYYEFPLLQQIHLKGYNISYANNKRFFSLKILFQTPKLFFRIYKEHKWLKKIIKQYKIDCVISDNRYGLWTNKIPCIFITHQLQIQAPNFWIEKVLQKVNYFYINRFSQCWIPDFETTTNIAGRLSHPLKLPKISVQYLGALSRFKMQLTKEKKYDLLIILSGPEPQRSAFEKKLLQLISQLKNVVLLVRGKPGSDAKFAALNNCIVVNHLTTIQMQQAFAQSEFVLSRSGYTTIMEILSMKKKSILIPTPGQTEQEYLGKHLMKQHWCYSFNENENMLQHLHKAKVFEYKFPEFTANQFQKIMDDFLNKSS
ncbi:MAG: glycosyltransferase [Chitinophagaceae bacterium]